MTAEYVAVLGPSAATAGELELARQVGALIAKGGGILVCGGLFGVMSSACEGAQRFGGVTVGILPGNTRSEANPFLTVALPTGLGEIRNALIIRVADVVIGIGGGWGTLTELAMAKKAGTPLVLLESWRVETETGTEQPMGIRVATPLEAVDAAFASVRERSP
ncbi:MAG: hypothetical protein QOE07_2828 [Acidimicrobiaceae bacterium]|jgi:uncharacterized protein (TIGR00725 family)|nr:hypothetical protein [Acidimicrobiaceae bacterium]